MSDINATEILPEKVTETIQELFIIPLVINIQKVNALTAEFEKVGYEYSDGKYYLTVSKLTN